MRPQMNIKGQRFGRLVAVEQATGHKWRFKCDCGNVKVMNKYSALNGTAYSCGCLNKDRKQVFPGREFGQLIAVSRVENSYNAGIWVWRCGCGNEFEARVAAVRARAVTSCGCEEPSQVPVMEGIFFRGVSIADIAKGADVPALEALKHIIKHNEVPT